MALSFERFPGPWHKEAPKTPYQKLYDHVKYLIKNVHRLEEGEEFPVLTADENDFLFTAYVFEGKGRMRQIIPMQIREDDAYAILNELGREPSDFSWDPSQEIKISGETFKIAVHGIRGYNHAVLLERIRKRGKERTGVRISIAARDDYYKALLKNPIFSPEDEELAKPFTALLRPPEPAL